MQLHFHCVPSIHAVALGTTVCMQFPALQISAGSQGNSRKGLAGRVAVEQRFAASCSLSFGTAARLGRSRAPDQQARPETGVESVLQRAPAEARAPVRLLAPAANPQQPKFHCHLALQLGSSGPPRQLASG